MRHYYLTTIPRYHQIRLIAKLLVFYLISGQALALSVYKWIDQYGVTHFSAEAPQTNVNSTVTVLNLEQPSEGSEAANLQSQRHQTSLELAKELERSRLMRECLRQERKAAERYEQPKYLITPQQNRIHSLPPQYYGSYRVPLFRRHLYSSSDRSDENDGQPRSNRQKPMTAFKGYRKSESPGR